MWWSYGIRPAGVEGQGVAQGLAIYAILRWFEATGKHDELASELTLWRETIEKIERAGVTMSPLIWRAAQVALALYASGGSALREELRRWCATGWGCAVPVDSLTKRLAEVGVRLPSQSAEGVSSQDQ
jgi:hypothetical protein